MIAAPDIQVGDYVVATKYSDGDPGDHFAVGFIASSAMRDRWLVVDNHGQPFRANGFRRVQRITARTGAALLLLVPKIEQSSRSVWDFVRDIEAAETA